MKKNRTSIAKNIYLISLNKRATKGYIKIGNILFPCSLGKHGRKINKKERDGTSPIGSWNFREFLFRPDKHKKPQSFLKGTDIKTNHLWCDDPTSSLYNQKVKLPFNKSAEKLWRKDHQYDLVIVIDYNISPCIKGKGSAIFLHIIKNNKYPPTEGCLAVKKSDLLKILRMIGPKTLLYI